MKDFTQKKPGCLLSIFLLVLLAIGGLIVWTISSAAFIVLLSWPFWLGEWFGSLMLFAEGSIAAKIGIGFGLLLIAWFFYKLKKSSLIAFGAIEIVGGIFVIWGSLVSPSLDHLTNALAIGGALFLLIQGFEKCTNGDHSLEEIKLATKSEEDNSS